MPSSDVNVTSLVATPGVGQIALTALWLSPAGMSCLPYVQAASVEFWGGTINNRASATKLGQSDVGILAHGNLPASTTYYYWARAVDPDGNFGAFYPASATAGVSATTRVVQPGPGTVGTAELADNSITGLKLQNFIITTNKIVNAAITAALIAASAVGPTQLADLAVNTQHIAANAVTTAQIADDAVTAGQIAAGAVNTSELANNAVLTANIGLLAITTARIAESAVTTTRIANEAVTAGQLAAGAVGTSHLQLLSVTSAIIANNAVTTTQIAANAVGTAQIASGAVTASQIASGAVGIAKFASGLTPVEIAAALPATGNYAGRQVFLTSDNKLYRHTGTPSNASGFVAAVAAADVTGTLTNAQIADLAAAKLTGQIVGTQITDLSISTPKLTAGAVTTAKITALSITTAELAAGAVTTAKITAGSITTALLAASSVTANELAANSVVAGKVAAGVISATEIVSGAVTASKVFIGDTSNIFPDPAGADPLTFTGSYVRAANIFATPGDYYWAIQPAGGTVDKVITSSAFPVEHDKSYFLGGYLGSSGTAPHTDSVLSVGWYSDIAASTLVQTDILTTQTGTTARSILNGGQVVAPATAIRGRLILTRTGSATATASNAVLSSPIVRRASSGELIVDGAITTIKLAALSVTAATIASATITAAQIATGTITALQIATGTITATQMTAGTITALQIAAGTITSTQIAAGTIVAGNIASGAIQTTHLAAGSVTTLQLDALSVTAGKLATDSVTSAKVLAGSIVASKLDIGDTSNSFPDPNLSEAAGWSGSAFSILDLTSWVTPGNRYLSINSTGGTVDKTVQSSAFPVETGRAYWVGGYIGSSGTSPHADSVLSIRWYSDAAATTVLQTDVVSTQSGTTSRTTLTGAVATAPATAVRARLRFTRAAHATSTSSAVLSYPVARRAAAGELIVDGTITTIKLAAASVTTAIIAANTIQAANIAAGTITGANIAALTVTASNIAAGTITATEILSGTITGNRIAAGTIQTANMAAGSISANEIASGAVTTAKLAALSVTAATIAAGTITADKFNISQLSAITANLGTVTAGSITGVTITGGTVRTANSTTRVEMDSGNNGLFVYKAGTLVVSINPTTGGPTLGLLGQTNAAAVDIVGYNGTVGHGIRASSSYAGGGRGLVGVSTGYAFYTEVGGYGSFTGQHDAFVMKNSAAVAGDLMVATGTIIAREGVDNVVPEVALCSTLGQKGSYGVVSIRGPFDPTSSVSAMPLADGAAPGAGRDALSTTHDRLIVNAIGEGQINVVGTGGNIAVGDLLCASATPGKATRENSAELLALGQPVKNPSAGTVAKAIEPVTFATPGTVKMVACVYMCG